MSEPTEYRLTTDPNLRGVWGNRRGDMIATSITVLASDVRVEVYERDVEAVESDVTFTRVADLRLSAPEARALARRLSALANAADRQVEVEMSQRQGVRS